MINILPLSHDYIIYFHVFAIFNRTHDKFWAEYRQTNESLDEQFLRTGTAASGLFASHPSNYKGEASTSKTAVSSYVNRIFNDRKIPVLVKPNQARASQAKDV